MPTTATSVYASIATATDTLCHVSYGLYIYRVGLLNLLSYEKLLRWRVTLGANRLTLNLWERVYEIVH